jgi:hypothetical protein
VSIIRDYYYLASCAMCLHLRAPISQLSNLSPPIVSIGPILLEISTVKNVSYQFLQTVQTQILSTEFETQT